MADSAKHSKHFLLVSDFDQTLSFNDSGVVLSELIGAHGFHDKVEGLARSNLVQQGAELAFSSATTRPTAACDASTSSRPAGASGCAATWAL